MHGEFLRLLIRIGATRPQDKACPRAFLEQFHGRRGDEAPDRKFTETASAWATKVWTAGGTAPQSGTCRNATVKHVRNTENAV
jgi:hypothetical protein